MNWKDYLYFQKRDRVAIILLLVLITLTGGIYIFTRPQQKANKEEAEPSSVRVTTNTNTPYSNTIPTFSKQNKDKTPGYPYQKKLETGGIVELNTADTTSLKMIPGIGTGFAKRIVKYRNLLGGFADITQLKEVWGLDNELYDKITPYIVLVPQIEKIKVNSADFNELNRHPYIDYKQARVIADIREWKGRIESLKRLRLLEEFTDDDIKRLTPYLSFD
ncbi:helix-hairpin-helix domain-containing protein [Dysgonomonas sp. GY75]|uniref:ComEA family DNA-binding protein n=1 Tax=Dysgonomonas sp. GY75 TaxID=2780419 RepID=UPI0018842002|nr:helix-hairpin-helix domain-containing protein [Dysgonomonas sp. GY75]MBF0650564.1 helix-hairpin-helix domain-containing protein [Dysgonomonas sp. GY75]